jgi:hypothetical protein
MAAEPPLEKINMQMPFDLRLPPKTDRNRYALAMRCGMMIIIILITQSFVGIWLSCANTPATGDAEGKTAPATGASKLTMVLIRTSSPGGLKQLRAMPIDIIRVRPDPQKQTNKHSLAGAFIVEAVVPKHILPRVKAKGFDVCEVPQKDK